MNSDKPLPVNGALLVDKPTGLTSHDVVYKIRKHFGQKSVGHAGTLDPLANGLLVILLGEATKLSRLILNENKSYKVGVKFGLDTDTWDTDGQILREQDINVEQNILESAIQKVLSFDEYPLPIYSAVKVKGKKLYEYAREDQEVEVPTRPMRFFDVKNLEKIAKDEYSFNVSCLKGGYIRTLAHCLGKELNSFAVVNYLRRTHSEPFKIEDAMTLDSILNTERDEIITTGSYKSLKDLLSEYKAMTVSGRDERLMRNGAVPKDIERRLVFDQKQVNRLNNDTYIKIFGSESLELLSLLHLQPKSRVKVFRRFNV